MQAETNLGDLAFQAEGGDASAQYRLGVLFLLGESVEQDLQAGHRWLTKAAENQYPGAVLLTKKLANCDHIESASEERSISARITAREWMKSSSSVALAFYRRTLASIGRSAQQILDARVWKIRGWKTEARNLLAKVGYSDTAEIPVRRREGFQFRDSL
ncbi:TPR repeat protein [Silvibacterium bohemicum]|uniref:TPR repeat protein n=1 Tax=Silvibacterium bohemicum TaxID=1577686 RepID=A0A841JQH3_9BACT|nr:SEL1-like repeat protein [Silvibacterium bohemicum]MBB6143613.1 TPR repeat protein [Silvibacterium bohemicum]